MTRIIRTQNLQWDSVTNGVRLRCPCGCGRAVPESIAIGEMPKWLSVDLMQEWDEIAEEVVFEHLIRPKE